MKLMGIHHVSIFTANARANFDFYTKIMGLRLVKKSVNQDDPYTYHLYYGDEIGSPGTALTFFEVPNMVKTTHHAMRFLASAYVFQAMKPCTTGIKDSMSIAFFTVNQLTNSGAKLFV